jgi:hypothetical protein
MNKNLLKVVPFAVFVALAAGCASNSSLDQVKSSAAAAQKTADDAKAAAAAAQQTANEAKTAADEANTKIDRAFKKSMRK